MKSDIIEKIEIPEGVEVSISGKTIQVKNGDEELSRKLNFKGVEIKKEDNSVVLEAKNATKRESKMLYTSRAHINNMLKGVSEGFNYKLEIVYAHFPITVEVNNEQKVLTIKNFLGEKKVREAAILSNVDVKVEGNNLIVESYDKENAGQTAANIEKATWVRSKDRRKFQDGIYIVEKNGRAI